MELIDKYSLVGEDGLFSKRGCHGNCNNCSLWSEEGCRVILEAPTVDVIPVDKIFMTRFTIDKNTHVPEAIFLLDGKEYPARFDPVDIMEVVHGKWIEDGESIYCSVCGFETSSMVPYVCDGEKWVPCYANKYCGNCGAKMDLK